MPTIYGSREQADDYFAARGNQSWGEASETDRDAALVRASAYIDGRYRDRFSGRKTGGRPQEREWPRIDAVDASGTEIADDEIPVEIVSATFEAAVRELQAPGSLSPDVVGTARVLRERVGDLEVQYADVGDPAASQPIVSAIDDILSGLLVRSALLRSRAVSFLARA